MLEPKVAGGGKLKQLNGNGIFMSFTVWNYLEEHPGKSNIP